MNLQQARMRNQAMSMMIWIARLWVMMLRIMKLCTDMMIRIVGGHVIMLWRFSEGVGGIFDGPRVELS